MDCCEKTAEIKELYRIFCQKMKVVSQEMGLSDQTFFNDPCGGKANHTTARDLLRWLIRGWETPALREIWGTPLYNLQIKGENAREMPLISTVLADNSSHLLTDHYEVLGGKTGSMERFGCRNLALIAREPGSDQLLACVVLYAEEANTALKNRFQAAREALDAAVTGQPRQVCARSAIVCVIPDEAVCHDRLDILFEQNADEVLMPASTTKILTASIGLGYLEDPEEEIRITREDIGALPDKFYSHDILPGDILTVRELIYAMMLPSSNAAAFIFASIIARQYLR